MSVWEKVYKNPRSRVVAALGNSLSVPNIKLSKRGQQLPSLILGLALGTTFTKRTFLCQLGSEVIRWNPETPQSKEDFSVFRVERAKSDKEHETSLGEESLSNFMSDRSEPPCTLFLQPSRFLLPSTRLPSYVTTYDGQKILYQSPTNRDVYKLFIRSQLHFLWERAHKYHSDIRRFQVGQIIVEYPDYFATPDIKNYRQWFVEAAEEFFPPILSPDEEQVQVADRFIFLPESLMTFLHWLTDQIETKLAAPDLDLKKLMVRYGILPRLTDSINFLIVTMGGTHSRVVRLSIDSIEQVASAKRVGETVGISHSYLGRTGFGGDHISGAFLEEEEERRYGATAAHKVSTLSRKVLEDWSKMSNVEGKKHFEELFGDQYKKAIEKLSELTIKGFGESPENTLIILGGKVFDIPYFRDTFKEHLNQCRIPLARIVSPSDEEVSIERVCEILQDHQKGLGRLFTVKSGLEKESGQKFTWKIGKVVEGTLVDGILEPDHRDWNTDNPREFTITFAQGVSNLNLGYQKTAGGLSSMWANISIKKRVIEPVDISFRTEAPDDLKLTNIKAQGKTQLVAEDVQIKMLIAGEHPSHYPLYEKLLKVG